MSPANWPRVERPSLDQLAAHSRSTRATVAAVVAEQPWAAWLFLRPATRAAFCTAAADLLCQHAETHADVHTSDDGHGVLIWYTIDDQPDPARPLAYGTGDLVRAITDRLDLDDGPELEEAHRRLRRLREAYTHHQPARAHHQVAFLGVHPQARRRGLAPELLTHHSAHLDAAHLASYAVATNRETRALLKRHGYHITHRRHLSKDGPRLCVMWREPVDPHAREQL